MSIIKEIVGEAVVKKIRDAIINNEAKKLVRYVREELDESVIPEVVFVMLLEYVSLHDKSCNCAGFKYAEAMLRGALQQDGDLCPPEIRAQFEELLARGPMPNAPGSDANN